MSGDQDLVAQTVRDILEQHEPFALTAERPWDADLWRVLAESGLTGVGISEEAGGSGGEFADAVAVVRTLAEGAAAVPVAEQLLVAGPAVEMAGLPLPSPEEPLTFALPSGPGAGAPGTSVSASTAVSASGSEGSWTLSGTAAEVPWAAVASTIAVVAQAPDGPVLALVPTADVPVQHSSNLAGEPRGRVRLDGVRPAAAAGLTPAQVDELRARYALARAVQLSAALEQILAWTVQYAGERQQFGRPLGKFQAIQMELAQMAGEVTAVAALVDAAVQAAAGEGRGVLLGAAAAKVRAGAAVEVVAKLAHQVHGAIGFTQEHRLHHLTRRCWAWRDEAGSELAWSRVLGAGLVGPASTAGGGPALADGLWPALTAVF